MHDNRRSLTHFWTYIADSHAALVFGGAWLLYHINFELITHAIHNTSMDVDANDKPTAM